MKMATVMATGGCRMPTSNENFKVFRVWQRTTTSSSSSTAAAAKLTKFLHPFAHVVGGGGGGGWFRGSLFRWLDRRNH